jgi:hypothetical protein
LPGALARAVAWSDDLRLAKPLAAPRALDTDLASLTA